MVRGFGGRVASGAELHRLWLELVDTDGPFLSVPALRRVWPQGMAHLPADMKAVIVDAKPGCEKAWEFWDIHRDDPAALEEYRQARDEWVHRVIGEILGWDDLYDTTDTPVELTEGVRSPDYTVTVTPTGALIRDGVVGALVLVVDPVDSLRDRLDDGWAISPIDRMEELLRHHGVPIG